jgi:hypothetical protein
MTTETPGRTMAIQLWSDLLCPFAHVGVHRRRQTRERLGLTGRVRLDHHVFPLALFNGPHPRRGTDSEAVDLGQIAPEDFTVAQTDAIPGSPTLRLPDGTTVTNSVTTVHWERPWAAGYPIVDADAPSVSDDLLRRAAQPSPGRSSP